MSSPIAVVNIVKGEGTDTITDKSTLSAECYFIGIGKIKIEEKLTTGSYEKIVGSDKVTVTEPLDTAERYLVFTATSLNGLCPRSSYTLTIH